MGRKLWLFYRGKWGKVIAILAGIYAGYSFFADITGIEIIKGLNTNWGQLAAVVAIILYFVVNNWALRNQLEDNRETLPNIQFEKFGSEVLTLNVQGQTIFGTTINLKKGDTLERFYLEVVNKKKKGITVEDAVDVYVNIKFIDMRCRVLYESDKPRWWRKFDPFKPETWDTPIDIGANEKPEQLFLVVRKVGEKDLYIFNRESHKQENWIAPQLKLSKSHVYIHVRLTARRGDPINYWVELDNRKVKPKFTLLEGDPCQRKKKPERKGGKTKKPSQRKGF